MSPLLDSNLISTKKASELSGYNADYIGRLCRSGKINGERIGRAWVIDEASLRAFMAAQHEHNENRARELSESRAREYHAAQKNSISGASVLAISDTVQSEEETPAPVASPVDTRKPVPSPFHKSFVLGDRAAALLLTLAILNGSIALAHTDAIADTIALASTDASAALDGTATFARMVVADIPSYEEVGISIVRGIENNLSLYSTALTVSGDAVYAVATNIPTEFSDVGAALARVYESGLADYIVGIENVSDVALDTSAQVRDTVAQTPLSNPAATIAIAFGETLISVSENILRAHATALASFIDISDAAPRTIVATVLGTGEVVGAVAANIPQGIAQTYQHDIYAIAEPIADAGLVAAKTSSAIARSLSGSRSALASAANFRLTSNGSTETWRSEARLAAAAEGTESTNIGRSAALYTYITIRNLFTDTENAFVSLFAPKVAVEPTVVPAVKEVPVRTPIYVPTTTAPRAPVTPVPSYSMASGTTIQNITNQFVTTGVSYEYLEQRLRRLSIAILDRPSLTRNSSNSSSSGGGSGSVTSVDVSGDATGFSFAGGPITSSGTFTLSGVLDIDNGGTGIATAPSYGELLMGDGLGGYSLVATSSLGITGGSGSPGGANTQVQFNNAGAFAGDAGFVYDSTADRLTVTNASTTNISSSYASSTAGFFGALSIGNLSGLLKSVAGVVSVATGGTDYENPLTFAYPLQRSVNAVSLAFGTTTANTWGAQNTFTGLFATNASSTNATTTAFGINSETFTDLTGTGLQNVGGALTLNATGDWTGSFDGQQGTFYLDRANHTGTQLSSTISDFSAAVASYINGSSTIPHIGGSAYGDILSWTGSAWERRATSTLGIALTDTTGTLGQAQGGTGITSYTAGDLLYANGGGTLTPLGIGSAGQVLKVTGGLPQWGADLTTGGGGGAGAWATTSDSLAIYPTDTSDVVIVGNSATTTANSILEVFGRSYFSNFLGIGTTSPGAMLSVAGNALINGTVTALGNITGPRFVATSSVASVLPYASTTGISASYASSTNLFAGSFTLGSLTGVLKATAGAISTGLVNLATEVTGTLGISNGGTGTSTPGALGDVLSWNGTNWQGVATSTLGFLTNAVTAIGPAGQTADGPTVTFATSTGSFNGLTTAITVTGSGDTLTFVPSITGTLNNAGLTNSTVSYGGVSLALGGTDATPAFNLVDATGLPISTGVAGLGTSVATALGVNVGTAGAFVVNGGALGTPSSGTLTNATGLPIIGGTTGTLSIARGGTGTTTAPVGQVLYGGGDGVYQSVATTSVTIGSGLSYSGTFGSVLGGASGSLTLDATGNWTGTFDGQEGSYYLANSFSTTSANFWETQQTARTADDLTNNSIEDLSDVAAMTENLGDLFYWNGSSWADIATSSLNIAFTNLVGTASDAQVVDALTISGGTINNTPIGASTPSTGVFTNATTTSFGINAETFLDLTGTGLQNVGGALTLNATGDWTGTFDGQEGSYYLSRANHTGTQVASTISDFDSAVASYINASTTLWQDTTEASLEAFLTDVTNVFTNNDGALADDDLTNNSIEDLSDVAAMTENFGDLLYWNGSAWADIATSSLGITGTAAGSDTQVQFNNNGSFAGDSGFTYSSSTDRITVTYASTTGITSSYASSTAGFFGSLTLGSLTGVLKATAGAISTGLVNLATEVTGTLPVGNGGTGAATFTNNRLITGNGTSALVDEANLTFDGSLLTVTGNASTTQISASGRMYIADGSEAAPAFTFSNDTDTGFHRTGANVLAVIAGGTTNFQVNNSATFFTKAAEFDLLATFYAGATVDAGVLTVPLADATAPSITFASDTNTGIFGATDIIGFTTAGTERIRINASGNVGIGTTTPAVRLGIFGAGGTGGLSVAGSVSGLTTANAVYIDDNGGEARFISVGADTATKGSFSFVNSGLSATGFTTAMTITSAGNVGIGTTSPWRTFSVSGNSDLGINALAGSFTATTTATSTFPTLSLTGRLYDSLGTAGTNGYVLQTTGSASQWVSTSSLNIAAAAGGSNTQVQYNSGGALAGSSNFVFDGTNVGIGAAPTRPLHVTGTANDTTNGSVAVVFGTLNSTTNSQYGLFVNPTVTLASAATVTKVGFGFQPYTTSTQLVNTTLVGGQGGVYLDAASGSTSALIGLQSINTIAQAGGMATTSYSVVAGVTNAGKLDNTYGFYAGDLTSGTQTNTPYSFYASDSGTYNYFAGSVGIGSTTPILPLSINGNGSYGGHQYSLALSSVVTAGPGILFTGNTAYDGNNWQLAALGSGNSAAGATGGFAIIDRTNNVSRLVLDSAGDVGIGTTTPYAKLSITNTGSGPSFLVEDATSTDTTPFVIDAAGLVGIGTTTPYAKLSVVGSAVIGGSAGSSLSINNGAATDAYVYFDSALHFAKNGTGNRISILDGGNVGIGDSTPDYKFEVEDSSSANLAVLTIANSAAALSTSTLAFAPGNSDPFSRGALINAFNNGSNAISLGFSVSNGATPAEALRISPTGTVGIGTTSPYGLLSITNTGSGPSFIVEDAASPDSTPFIIDATGNVAIGGVPTLPSKVTVVGASGEVSATPYGNSQLTLTNAGEAGLSIHGASGSTSYVFFGTTGASGNTMGRIAYNNNSTGSSGSMAFFTDNAERLRIGGTGNIGIATTSPFGLLSIEQGTETASLWVGNTGSTTPSLMVSGVNGDGRVGVGVNSPNAKLDILAGSATALSGTAFSTLLRTNAGALGTTATNELALASIGYTTGNSAALGVRAYRTSAGSDWTTQAIGLSMDVDSTVRAGAQLWLHANGRIGVATSSPGGVFSIEQGLETYSLYVANTGSTSPSLVVRGVNGNGQVGIGVASPTAALHVSGGGSAGDELVRLAGYGPDQVSYNLSISSVIGSGTVDYRFRTIDNVGGTKDVLYFDSSSGFVGTGTTTPWRKFSVSDTVSTAQFAISYDTTRYTQLHTDSNGDFMIDSQGGDILSYDETLWICSGGACPSGSPAATGSIIAETAIGIGSSTPYAALSIVAGKAIAVGENTLATSTSMTIDWRNGNQQLVRTGTSATSIAFTGYIEGQKLVLTVCNPNATAGAITFTTQVLWAGGTAPTQTTTANKCDVWSFLATAATSTMKIFGTQSANF